MVDFKNFLSSKKETSKQYYWALVLEPEWVQAGIWEVKEGRAEVVSISPPTAWGEDEELVSAADAALSAAVQDLAEGAKEPSKTVFGVSSTWVSEGQIKPEYREKLRRLCSDLSLEPSGFVVLPEAIAHFIKTQEGSPLSAIALGLGSENLEISVFRLGNLVGTTQVARSVSIGDDVSEGLSRFAGGEPLPSRLLLYNGKEGELEEAKQSLLSVQWDDYEKLKFLHTPKAEIIDSDKKVVATALAGASEIAEVSEVRAAAKKEEVEEISKQAVEDLMAPDEQMKPEDVGFVIGQDVATSKSKREEPKKVEEKVTGEATASFEKKSIFDIFGRLKKKLTSIIGRRPRAGLKAPAGKKTFVLGGVVFGLVMLVGFILWWIYPKAVVTIYVAPKKLDEKITILIDTKTGVVDFREKVLSGKLIEATVSGEETTSTTGTKVVGERARGEVEIQNGTPENIRLPSGTVIVTNNFEFTLDSSASVSAKASPKNPGTVTVNVTAADIGADYNLAKDTTFEVGNYLKLDVLAVSTSAFSGGSSREIAAVSTEDQEILEEGLKEELLDNAKQELNTSISESEFLIDDSLVATTSARNFSHKVGDETSSLALDLTLSVSALVIEKMNLDDLVKEVLKDRIPSGFVLREDQIGVDFELEEEKDGVFEFSAMIDVNLLPEVKPEEIAKKIAGRYPPIAREYLTTVPGFSRAEINIKPKLPGRLGTLPHLVKNLTIELAAER